MQKLHFATTGSKKTLQVNVTEDLFYDFRTQ